MINILSARCGHKMSKLCYSYKLTKLGTSTLLIIFTYLMQNLCTEEDIA